MSTRRDFRAMTREAAKAEPVAVPSAAALAQYKILGGLLLLSAP
jgi:hypothetical protein